MTPQQCQEYMAPPVSQILTRWYAVCRPHLTTYVYHISEQHLSTKDRSEVIMILCEPEARQQAMRMGNGSVNISSRGYVEPQLQVEHGHEVRFSCLELSTQKFWLLKPEDGVSVFSKIHESVDRRIHVDFQ